MNHHTHQADGEIEDHDRGLVFDLDTLLQRRNMLKLLAGGGLAVALAACGSSGSKSSATQATTAATSGNTAGTTAGTTAATAGTTAGTTAATSGDTSSIGVVPEETAGPFPGDGSNGANVLTESGVVRNDIRTSFGSYSGTASGIDSTISLTVLDSANGNAPLAGAAVYLWHADQAGHYSLYTAKDQNYLRGVQVTDANGTVTFTSIFPACYDGRWPHIHYEVYSSVDDITNAGNKIATSQIALPEDACNLVYATDGYEQSVSNMTRVSLETDNVFSDGWDLELGTVTGSVDTTMAIALTVAV